MSRPFFDLEKEGLVKRTDASIEANKGNLSLRAANAMKNLNPLNQENPSPSVEVR
jgi:hypothetical protein